MKFSKQLFHGAIAIACLTAIHGAFAQDAYPSKPIKIMVGFAPGGPADGLARIVAESLGSVFGQPLIVENRPGAGGTIAAAQVAKSPPDGYTLLLVSSGHAGNGAFYGNLSYEAVKSFSPIGGVASTPVVVLVNASSPYQTLSDLINDAKKNPGKLNYGTGGGATLTNLAAEQLKSDAGFDAKGVGYKGTGPVLAATLSGEIDAAFDTVTGAIGLTKAGKLRILAVTSAKRSTVLPQIPTAAEQGVPRFDTVGWYGIIAPAGTPAPVITKFNAELNKALASAAVREKLTTLGAEAMEGSPAQFTRFMESETTRWSTLIRKLNLRPE